MPFMGANGIGVDAVQTERVYLGNVAATSDEATVYVNSDSGDDNNSGYDPGYPVRTLARACNELPVLGLSSVVGIRLEGSAPHLLPDNFIIPPMVRAVKVSADFTDPDGFSFRGPVRIYSPPVELFVLTDAEITGVSFPDNSQLVRVSVNITIVPGELVGKWTVDGLGLAAQIAANTDSDFDLCYYGDFVRPLRVLDYGAIIQNVAPSFNGTIRICGGSCPVILQGLQIQGGDFSFFPAVDVAQGSSVLMQACNIEGLWINEESGSGGVPAGAQLSAVRMERNLGVGSGELQAQNSFFPKADWVLINPNSLVAFQQCIFDTCDNPVCFDANFTGLSPGTLALIACRIVSASAGAIKYKGAGNYLISEVNASFNAGAGCVLDGGSGRAFSLQGTNNGAGLVALNGTQCEVSDVTNINEGFVDALIVGSQAYVWPAFRPFPLNFFDVAIPAGQLARVWQVGP